MKRCHPPRTLPSRTPAAVVPVRPGIALLFLILSACAGLPRSDAVKVSLVNLYPLDATLLEQRFRAELRIQNRSRDALEVEGLSFDLELNGRKFASGVSNHRLTIEGLSDGVIPVDLSGTLFGLIRQVQALPELERKPFRYAFHGTLYVKGSAFGIPFSDEGELDLGPSGHNMPSADTP